MKTKIAFVVVLLVAFGAFALAQDAELCGQIDKDGRLNNVSRRVPGQGDVVLAAPPLGRGPWKYDAGTKLAVVLEDADRTDVEKVAMLDAPTSTETAALFVLLSSQATPEAKAKAQVLVDARATVITTKLGW